MAKTIRELVLEYFVNHPNEDLQHGPVVDWVSEQYSQEHGKTSQETRGEPSGSSIKTENLLKFGRAFTSTIRITSTRSYYLSSPRGTGKLFLNAIAVIVVLSVDAERLEMALRLPLTTLIPKDKGGTNDN